MSIGPICGVCSLAYTCLFQKISKPISCSHCARKTCFDRLVENPSVLDMMKTLLSKTSNKHPTYPTSTWNHHELLAPWDRSTCALLPACLQVRVDVDTVWQKHVLSLYKCCIIYTQCIHCVRIILPPWNQVSNPNSLILSGYVFGAHLLGDSKTIKNHLISMGIATLKSRSHFPEAIKTQWLPWWYTTPKHYK